jgi:hypothetical protein
MQWISQRADASAEPWFGLIRRVEYSHFGIGLRDWKFSENLQVIRVILP